MGWLLASLRHLRVDRAPALGLAGIVFVTAFIFGLAPRVLDRVADESLRSAVASAPAAERQIQLIEDARVGSDARGPLYRVEEAGVERERRMAPGLQELIADRRVVVDSPRWSILARTPTPSTVRFRFQPGAAERIELVDGRAPTDATREVSVTAPTEAEPSEAIAFEGALATQALDTLGVSVGDIVLLEPDRRDRLFFGTNPPRLALEVVGAFEPRHPDDPFWFDDDTLWEPTLRALTSDVQFIDVQAFTAIGAYGQLLQTSAADPWSFRYTYRYAIDVDRLDADQTDALVADLRRMEATFRPQTSFLAPTSGTLIRSALLRLVEEHRTRWGSATAVLTVAAIGPSIIACATIGLVALAAAYRRRASLAVTRSRGASLSQIAAATLAEGVLLVVLPAALALLAALVVVATGPPAPTIIAAGFVAGGAAILVLATVLREALRPPRGTERDAAAQRPTRRRRLVAEGLVVVLAIAGAWLLRERGISGSSTAAELGSGDPFIAAAPALAGVAAGLVAVRLVPLPLGLLGRVAAYGRGLVPVHSLRRATRGGAAAPVLAVLLAGATIGAFALATLVQLDTTARAVSWHEVGAPFRLRPSAFSLPAGLDAELIPGVTATSGATRSQVTTTTLLRIDLLAVDVRDFVRVTAGTPGDVRIPAEMLANAGPPYPAIVSQTLSGDRDGPEPGEVFTLHVAELSGQFQAVEVRDTFPTLRHEGRFIVVSREHLRAADPSGPLETTEIFIRADDASGPALRDALETIAPGAILEGRAEREQALRTAPVVSAVFAGAATAALIAALYAAVAMMLAVALAGASRATEVGQLRTLGLSRRQTLGLVVGEHGPIVFLAFVCGGALGVAIFQLLGARIGLAAVIGSALDVPLELAPVHIGVLIATIIAVAAVGIALAAYLQRRIDPSGAVRRGME